jgi:hypothetical protein
LRTLVQFPVLQTNKKPKKEKKKIFMKHFYNYTYTVNTFFVVLGVPLDICHVCPPPSHTYRGTSTPYSNKHSFESSADLKADLDSRMHQPSSLTLPH